MQGDNTMQFFTVYLRTQLLYYLRYSFTFISIHFRGKAPLILVYYHKNRTGRAAEQLALSARLSPPTMRGDEFPAL